METRISLLTDFVESLETKDAIFKRSVLEGIEAMDYSETNVGRAGMRRINNTKWSYAKSDKGISFGHDGTNVALDEDDKKELLEKGKFPPLYIKSLDSLFFGGNAIVSPYGLIKLPYGTDLEPLSGIPDEIKGAIFIATDKDDKIRNFMSIRDRGNGEYQYGYLFGQWGRATRVDATDTGIKLSLLRRGKTIAELLLPELERNDDVEGKDEFFTDPRDNKKYRIVKIGSQTWMAENLNWEGKGKKKIGFAYDDKSSNADKYGRLYTWKEALTVAPPGWHLPTDEEWTALTDFAGGAENAASALKAEEWDGDDGFGFSALPGGYRYRDGDFYNVGDYGRWWSATERDSDSAYCRYMHSGDARVYRNDGYKGLAFSVRLLQD